MSGMGGALVMAGVFFFLAGSIGLLRLPDLHARLHALTKADNLGLGLVVIGLELGQESLVYGLKLLLVWWLVLLSSSTSAYLIARRAARRGGA